jgi:hypothetical protein
VLNVTTEIKNLCKQDNALKTETIHFPSIGLTMATQNGDMDAEASELTESICPDGNLRFGACNSAQKRITFIGLSQNIAGLEFADTHYVDGNQIPLGIFIVDSCTKQDDMNYKDVIAYDRMQRVDVDVASWYNSLFPTGTEIYTLAQFRASFLAYVGLAQDTSKLPLPNDSMTVKKTIEPAELPGREVIEAIEEINGVFGQINRSGQFTHVILKPTYGDYPTNDYPTNDYPISESDTTYTQPGIIDETITENMREAIRFEEYTVAEIDKLVIRSDDADYGAIVGTGTNAYFITGNFLVFGKSAAELQTIATNAAGYIFKRPYRPYESEQIGLPYVEVGDLLINENTDTVKGYVLNRTLKGIQALRDTVSASGSKETKQTTSVNRQFKILDYKTLKIQTDVDGVRIEVTDLGADVSTQISALAGEVSVKVSKSDVIQSINLSTEGLQIDVTKLDINGIVTANNNFKIQLDGSMEAVNGKFQGQITGGSININGNFIVNADGTMSATGANINGSLTNTGASGTVTINNGLIVTTALRSTYIGNDGSRVSQLHVNTIYLDGEIFDPGLITTLYARGGGIDSPRNVYLDSSQNLVPSTASYDFGLGNSSVPWNSLYIRRINHMSGGTLGLFGTTPTSRKTVPKLSTGADLAAAVSKINAILDAFGNSSGYGALAL